MTRISVLSGARRRSVVGNVAYLDLPGSASNPVTTAAPGSVPATGIDIRFKCNVRTNPSANRQFLDKTGQPWGMLTTFDNRVRIAWRNAAGFQNLSSDASMVVLGTMKSYRATLESDGGTGSIVKFFTSTDWDTTADTGTWTQFGATQTSTQSPTFNYNAQTGSVFIGATAAAASSIDMQLVYASARPPGGAEFFAFDATRVTRTAVRTPNTYVGVAGNTWSLTGSTWDWVLA